MRAVVRPRPDDPDEGRYRRSVKSRPGVLSAPLVLAASALFFAGPLRAQENPLEEERPRLERVEIRGVTGVDMRELREGLATQPSRCRSFFFKPFCMFASGSFFVDRRRLDRRALPQDELRIRVHLWRRGWRHSTVATRVEPRGEGVQVVFDVSQGPATRIAAVELSQTDTVLSRRAIRRSRPLEVGDPVDVLEMDSTRLRLLEALWEKGYGDAQVRDTARLVDTLSAVLEVVIDPGRRTTVAEVLVQGNDRVTDATVRDAMPLREGGLYRPAMVAESQRALYLTGMFQQTAVDVPEVRDTAKSVVVTVREAPFRLIRGRVGFTTFDYLQTQLHFTQYNWLGGGRRLDLTGTLGRLLASQLEGTFPFEEVEATSFSGATEEEFLRPTWQASALVTQPAFPSAGTSLGLGVFTHRRVEPDVVVDQGYGANLTYTYDLAHRAPLSILYRFERNEVIAGDVYFCVNYGVCDAPTIELLQGPQSFSPVSISGFVDRVDDELVRSSGYTARLGLEHASDLTASSFHYNRAEAEFTNDMPLGRATLAARVRGGWVRALGGGGEDDPILHPTTRFYAGGARSVRGFPENQLGPRVLTVDPTLLLEPPDDDSPAPCTGAGLVAGDCDPNPVPSSEFDPRPVGGTRLLAASVEYRRPVWGNFIGAIFVDGARISDPALEGLGEARTAITPGFGIRYRSPVGPVRVDVGIKPARTEELVVFTEVVEEGVPRLVQLNVEKRYDPAEVRGGFLGELTSRVTLHLSLGEAF